MRSLSASERRLAIASAALLPLVAVGVRVLGLARMLNILGRPASRPCAEDVDVQRVAAIVAMAANNLPFTPTCLTRSLLLQWLLRRSGKDGQLRIGVCRPNQSQLTAHAWVECDGLPVGDPHPANRYAPFEARL